MNYKSCRKELFCFYINANYTYLANRKMKVINKLYQNKITMIK